MYCPAVLSKNKSRRDEQDSCLVRVFFRPEGIYFWIMTDGQYIIPLIIRLLAKNYRRHSSKIPLFNDLVAVS